MSHPWNPKLRKSMATEDNTSLRVASFSCYLDTAKENLVHVSAKDTKKLSLSTNSQETPSFSFLNTSGEKFAFKVSGPVQDPAPASSFPQETPIPINLERTKCKDGEIGVFGADKYFNVKLDSRIRVEPPEGSRNPSVCSQESCLKSQNVLLQRRRRIESKKKQKRLFGRSFCAGLVCQGPCFGEKSVRVNEIVAPGTTIESNPTRTESKRVDHFALQVPSCRAENLTVEEEELKDEKQNDPRISLEVFGSYSSSTKGSVSRNLERKLSMLTWDAIPKSGQNLKIYTPGNSTTICDDLASDASSDLFEIENISSISYSKLKVESDLDHMSSFTSPSPTKYAPSEASIEWSVVTASAVDYSSVISDYDEKKVSVAADRISRKIDRNSADYWDPRIIKQ